MKDIYELINDLDIDDFEEVHVDEIEKERVKKGLKKNLLKESNKRKKYIKIASIAGGIIVITSIFTISNPTFACKIPVIGKLFEKVYVDMNSDFLKYSEIIDKTISKDGIEITFHSVVISNDKMILDFTIKNNNEKITNDNMEHALLIPQKIKIDGRYVPTGAGARWEMIDDNTIRVVKDINIGSAGYIGEGKINVEINIDELFGVKNDFGVKFKYDKSEQDKNSVVKEIDMEKTIAGQDVVIKKASISPLTASISYITDATNIKEKIEFLAIDNNKNILNCDGGDTSARLDYKKYKNVRCYMSNKDVKSVTFIPYIMKTDGIFHIAEDEKIEKFNLDNKESFVVKVTDEFGMLIKECILDDSYLIIKYNEFVFEKEVRDSGIYSWDLIKENGKYTDDIEEKKWETLYKKYQTEDCHVEIFKINEGKNLEIGVRYNKDMKFYKDDAITINMDK